MESTFERLKRLYNEGRIDEAGLQRAVDRGVITAEQMDEIIRSNIEDEPLLGFSGVTVGEIIEED